ncbi:hypothetical protein BELL_0760g00040 [Botrytis elliptica]|uniref:Survival motor neuron Tudor domain-containing protein n=1 Tax=Botrytis elliptica TaxID=278938 RepID=A0A4Z1J7K9_9HELO|nr:hypothetical protein BELL_0760g00040 [Botrytis elliptica]
MASKNNASHAEVWDDSTLVDSWNEALQEYEVKNLYRFIHARGEKVEDVLNAFENQSNGLQVCLLPTVATLLTFCREGEMNEDNGEGVEGVEEPMEENVVMQSEFEQIDDNTQTANEPKVGDKSAPKATKFGSSSSKAPMLPPQLIGQVHDENLKNLLMSWYYAGYYTGLYEGQQQKQEPSKGT